MNKFHAGCTRTPSTCFRLLLQTALRAAQDIPRKLQEQECFSCLQETRLQSSEGFVSLCDEYGPHQTTTDTLSLSAYRLQQKKERLLPYSHLEFGFTLVELLVVIVIIALLAALLFPVFMQAREKARQTTCLSNTRQLALGVLLYAQDYDETLPPVQITNGNSEIIWPDLINTYVRNTQIRLCPSDTYAKINSYGLNELGFVDLTDTPSPPIVTLAAFQTPSETVMLSELGTQDNLVTDRPDAFTLPAPDGPDDPAGPGTLTDPADARPSARHFRQCNVSLMDGHVKAFRLEQFYTRQTPPDKWFTP